jgi:hypothetical protein
MHKEGGLRTVCYDETAQHEAVGDVYEGDDIAQDHGAANGRSGPEDGHGRLVDQEVDDKVQEEPAQVTQLFS